MESMTPPASSKGTAAVSLQGRAGIGIAELLADAQWVRALARTLAVDANEADDLAQEAYLQALRRPPGHRENLRGWFQRVLQNLVRQKRRATQRREARERAALPVEPVEPTATDDLVGRATTHRAVVDAVLRLDEPYRGTILLRFFEDLPPREIAARMGVPVATVHTRIQRGCARLRTRLDASFGDRRAWCAALLPLPQLAATVTSFELLLMNGKAIALGATLVVGASALWFGSGWFGAPAAPLTPEAPAVTLQGAAAPVSSRTADAREATAAARTAVATEPEPVAAAPTRTRRLEGRVVDTDGRALPDVQVALHTVRVVPEAVRARSDRAGSFALVADRDGVGRIETEEAAWQTVMFASVGAGEPPRLSLVVAAPKLALAGHVRSAEGRGIANADVSVVWPADLRARLSDNSDVATEAMLRTSTDADAAFTLDAARVRGAQLVTTADGFLPDRRPIPEVADAALAIVLHAPEAKPGMLQGQVVDPRGAPVVGARVALGPALERTDEGGNFILADDGKAALLSAAMVGHRRAALARPASGYPGFVTLTLGAEPLTIRGRVVDAEGKGIGGIKVWALDPTLLSGGRELFVTEGVAAGCTTMEELRDRYRRGELTDPERTLRETPTAAWPWVATGPDGAFTLTGLEDRAYRLRVMDDRTVLMVDADPVPAGSTDVVIRMRQDALFGSLRGQVVAHNGEPVPNARVHVQVDTQRLGGSTMHGRALATTTSDAEGRFELRDVPKEHAYLRLEGEGILPLEYGRGTPGGLLVLTNGDVRSVRIEVRVRLHVQVELSDPTSAEYVVVLDAGGNEVNINVFSGRGRRESNALAFADGKTPVFVLPDTATTLILRKGETEVRREALQLRAGDVNTLRY